MTENQLTLDIATTALVLIDLQKGVVGLPVVPHDSATVLANSVKIAEHCRALKMPVVLVRVAFAEDGGDILKQPIDAPPWNCEHPADWTDIVPELGPAPGDILITKHNWGAFYGTELDLQLRRRGIATIILAGIATNFGVESTARDAYERGYSLVLVEDAMASMAPGAHEFAIQTIFPRLGRVRSTAQVLASAECGVRSAE